MFFKTMAEEEKNTDTMKEPRDHITTNLTKIEI